VKDADGAIVVPRGAERADHYPLGELKAEDSRQGRLISICYPSRATAAHTSSKTVDLEQEGHDGVSSTSAPARLASGGVAVGAINRRDRRWRQSAAIGAERARQE